MTTPVNYIFVPFLENVKCKSEHSNSRNALLNSKDKIKSKRACSCQPGQLLHFTFNILDFTFSSDEPLPDSKRYGFFAATDMQFVVDMTYVLSHSIE